MHSDRPYLAIVQDAFSFQTILCLISSFYLEQNVGVLYQVFKLTDESAILPCHKSKQFYLSSLRLFNLTSRMWRCIILLPGLKMIDESAFFRADRWFNENEPDN